VHRVNPDATGYSAHSIRSSNTCCSNVLRVVPTLGVHRHASTVGPATTMATSDRRWLARSKGGLPRSLERLSPLPKPESPPALGVHPSIYSKSMLVREPIAHQANSIRTASSTISGVATRKVTLSIDHTAWALAQAAAARAGISPSAWLSAAARREAVRLGAGTDWGDTEAEALTDDADLVAAEADLRATG
jgi:hypothetical protein